VKERKANGGAGLGGLEIAGYSSRYDTILESGREEFLKGGGRIITANI